MPLDPSRIFGTPIADRSLSYEDRDAMLYALCCGADRAVAEGDFRYVREDGLQVVPSFGQNLCFFDDWMQPAGVDIAKVVHGGLDLRMEAPFIASGEVTVKTRIGGLTDKGEGKAALALQISEVWQGGKRVFTSYSNFFVMGAGGFGGSQGEAFASEPMPAGEPDQTHDLPTRSDSPLLFRLLGDRNPLHIDPTPRAKSGLSGPSCMAPIHSASPALKCSAASQAGMPPGCAALPPASPARFSPARRCACPAGPQSLAASGLRRGPPNAMRRCLMAGLPRSTQLRVNSDHIQDGRLAYHPLLRTDDKETT
ncbi:hypothetical protein [Gemmobacter sp. 24YEA27]|uniref:hypothetical protein n=1 Tax=Gemmobacter sp. 24YEA27 TaxID=3040672 RepID=UPI0024B382D8|nr:hypothetical protein [Gemmobacter sp. 24YEA27]